MDRLIHTAANGMSTAMVRQRLIASNLANAQTIGFRAEVLASTPVTVESADSLEVRALNRSEVRGASLAEGAAIPTGKPLDIACTGKTMLAVQTSDGGEAYTRRGDLSIGATGLLFNGDGLPVIGENGPITVPLRTSVTIAPDGAVLAANPAAPDAPPLEVGRIKLASWRGSPIDKGIDGLFRVPGGGVLPADADARVLTGTLEQSNVKPTEILVEMVEAQRSYDIRAKLISTARELDEGSAGLMRINA